MSEEGLKSIYKYFIDVLALKDEAKKARQKGEAKRSSLPRPLGRGQGSKSKDGL
jgi:hypothetical protein